MPPPSVSCLVISRTARLLNGLLASLETSRLSWGAADEVLCSWNGTQDEESAIQPPAGGPSFRIAAKAPYHFAANMNALAEQARGDVLILLNDDLVLDPGSLDNALQILESHDGIGLVGGRLRTPKGLLGHAGVLFTASHLPYNRLRPERLGGLLQASGLEPQQSGQMPAVTGALVALQRSDFLKVRLRETFHICGEDLALCLDLRHQLGLASYYANGVGAVHAEKSSRGEALDRHDDEQLAALAALVRAEDPSLEVLIARWASEEADVLEQLLQRSQSDLNATQTRLNQCQANLSGCEAHFQTCLQDHQRELEGMRGRWEAQRLDHQRELEGMRSSRSWTLTAPYRALGGWLARRRSRS